MPNYVSVKFTKGVGSSYTYELPENIKTDKIKAKDPIIVPAGPSNELKIAYVVGVQQSNVRIDPGFKIKQVYGLVRKI